MEDILNTETMTEKTTEAITYAKFCPNVWVAKCPSEHQKGDIIQVANKYGRENACIVFNQVAVKAGYFYYSIVRADGFDSRAWAARRAEKLQGWAESAEKKSYHYYERSNKDRAFLSLGEPIKVGHHSEGRHRKLFDQAHNNMGKFVEYSDKAKDLERRSEYWAARKNLIDLSMPESLEFYELELEKAIHVHAGIKSGEIPKEHSYSLVYANKHVKILEDKVKDAKRLWG